MSGYAGGASLTNGSIAQPVKIVHTPERHERLLHGCSFSRRRAPRSCRSLPRLGGSARRGRDRVCGTNGGGDFGAAGATATVAGSVSVTEDLTSIHYVGHGRHDARSHLHQLLGLAHRRTHRGLLRRGNGVAAGFPYSSVGIVECVLANAAQVTVPGREPSRRCSPAIRLLDTVRARPVQHAPFDAWHVRRPFGQSGVRGRRGRGLRDRCPLGLPNRRAMTVGPLARSGPSPNRRCASRVLIVPSRHFAPGRGWPFTTNPTGTSAACPHSAEGYDHEDPGPG